MTALAIIWALGAAYSLSVVMWCRAHSSSNTQLWKEVLFCLAAWPLGVLIDLMFAIDAIVWRRRRRDGRDRQRAGQVADHPIARSDPVPPATDP